jgi:hypothetical protein
VGECCVYRIARLPPSTDAPGIQHAAAQTPIILARLFCCHHPSAGIEQAAGNLVRNSDFTQGASGWLQPPAKTETALWIDGLDVIVHRTDETKHDEEADVVYVVLACS